MKKKLLSAVAAFLFIAATSAQSATVNHYELIKGPFKTGEDVTKACLQCHEKQAEEILQTPHWKWKGVPRTVKGLENSKEEYGKANLLNNFCTDVEGGSRPFCTKCHIGYGWTDSSAPLNDKSKIDCLVCHAKEGNYKKALGGYPDPVLLEKGKMDLVRAAKSVNLPDRSNCGVCHFFGGGGDAVKHGDLDSTLIKPTKDHDVHMGGPADMTCQACHVSKEHRIAGASTFLATNDGRVSCEDCHREPHRDSAERKTLDRHTKTVACQTCHIPLFAKGQATKMSWDWSQVGKDIEPEEKFGKETYAKHKGSFVWDMNVVPEYAWYDGKTERYLKGQVIKDPSQTVLISKPVGSIKDPNAKIFPFKVHRGKQPMDSKYKYLSIFQNYGGLWTHYNWQKALIDGAKASGLPYSGNFEFVSTAFYGSINHEVVPKEKALKCSDCHFGRDKRLDWKALGYAGDPMRVGGRFETNVATPAKTSDTRVSAQK
ncbi:MAG: tetrathionate reductase family octaheme c-type cytochrome [Nitrospiraceae bacterium]|nr:tetrathionate reductase family octaheme c-type cytochrome [Nitrospiraceae bacterium]